MTGDVDQEHSPSDGRKRARWCSPFRRRRPRDKRSKSRDRSPTSRDDSGSHEASTSSRDEHQEEVVTALTQKLEYYHDKCRALRQCLRDQKEELAALRNDETRRRTDQWLHNVGTTADSTGKVDDVKQTRTCELS